MPLGRTSVRNGCKEQAFQSIQIGGGQRVPGFQDFGIKEVKIWCEAGKVPAVTEFYNLKIKSDEILGWSF